ncbi:MAG: hypothetical protein CMP23_05775 [Rickettsiales bacterium]|nr:hypothetical protein [Rickettsiales bacterium]|tara:strand:- start:599 stop:889 length:291 start_codon:yes stop_codon:yes gene_type:complete
MIRHIVMVKLPEQVRAEALEKISAGMAPLPGKLSEIKYMDVGRNISPSPKAHDLAIVLDFEDEAGLGVFAADPDHKEVVHYIRSTAESISIVDYAL